VIGRAALLLTLAGGPALAAADLADAIGAASARVESAGAALAAAEGPPAGVVPLAEAVAGYEVAIAALEAGVAEAGAREAALAGELERRRWEVMRLLAALQAIGRTPAPPEGMHPQGPLAGARATTMMQRLTPALRAEAGTLSADVAELAAAHDLRRRGEEVLVAARARLGAARAALATAIAAAAPPADDPDSRALTMMARDSESLTALAAALAKSPDAARPPAQPDEGPLLWPVEGTVLRRHEEPDAAGVRRPGLVLFAPPQSLVRAPADAVVRYAGPFLEYGYVVVLEPDAETMVVLAGLAQLQARTGAAVRRGELLGLLGGRPPEVEEYVMPESGTGAASGETLYIEVRRGRGPVDPEPLFAGDNG
jgi:septal ring factor EnvC (AmiA/AmiB activator)